ncbi:unnamed protein product [Mytilus edulis]|uniref:Uncharacterized protein n=1 Tax=Mytilus edulis TaxID=6550 RepID=A0A8S3VGD5_MYTED|nr:unnamed protein product [Mytilus edulis]
MYITADSLPQAIEKEQQELCIQITNTDKDKKIWNKKHACLFRENLYYKIARHYEDKHNTEQRVAEILLLPKNSKQRKDKWEVLRNEANFRHNFDVIKNQKSTVKKLAGYDPTERSYGIPTLPVKIGYCLRRCAEINKSAGISANDKSKITNAKYFICLYDAEWNSRIPSIARQTSQKNKCNVQKLFPLCSDVQELFQFVKEEGERVRNTIHY